jgi:hypothetical protein
MVTNHSQINFQQNRSNAVNFYLRPFWPDHQFIWIDSYKDYVKIDSHLSLAVGKKCIVQTEEDWFKKTNWQDVRSSIKNHPNWDDQCFIITNSFKDYTDTSKFLKCVWRPGILDLICYQDLNKIDDQLNFSSIKKHTGFAMKRKDYHRGLTVDFLKTHTSKLSVLKYQDKLFYPKIRHQYASDEIFIKPAPFISVQEDLWWVKPSSFVLAFETHCNENEYAPTLSEKTFKAIHLCRPALIFGGPGVRDDLVRLGFDPWDWLINWDYDKSFNTGDRHQAFHRELSRLLALDLNEIKFLLEKNKDSLIHNKNRIQHIVKNYKNFI